MVVARRILKSFRDGRGLGVLVALSRVRGTAARQADSGGGIPTERSPSAARPGQRSESGSRAAGGRAGRPTRGPSRPTCSAIHAASATSAGVEQREPGARERLARRAGDHRRVGEAGADRVDRDAPFRRAAARRCGRTRRPRASSRVDRVVGDRRQPRERGGADDPPARRHDTREPADAEDDAVHVDAERAPVAVERELGRVGRAAEHAGVEAGDVDRPDVLPRLGIGDVEAGDEIERLDLEALRPQPGDERRADARRAARDERAAVDLTGRARPSRSSAARRPVCSAAVASASGKVAPTNGRDRAAAHCSSSSADRRRGRARAGTASAARGRSPRRDVPADEQCGVDRRPGAACEPDCHDGPERPQLLERRGEELAADLVEDRRRTARGSPTSS